MSVISTPDAVSPSDTTFYLAKDDQTFGPHAPGEIRSFLESGIISADDLLWTEGMEAWLRIGEIVPWPPATDPAAAPAHPQAPPIWARRRPDGLPKRFAIGVGTAIFLHAGLLVSLSLGAAVLFKLNSDEPLLTAAPEPAPLEVSMVEVAEQPPQPPPPPAAPVAPLDTTPPPPTPVPPEAPAPVVAAPAVTTPVPPLAVPPLPRAYPVALPAQLPTEAPPAAAPKALPVAMAVDAGPSDYLKAPPPPYPYAARQARQAGTVVLLVSINEDGDPVSVTVDQSSGYALLDAVAQKQVAHEFKFRVGNSRLLRVPISFEEK